MTERRSTPRTKDRALEVLLVHLARLRERVDDSQARELLSDELARAVFDLAWRHQFDDYRNDFQRRVRDTVEIAIESRGLGESTCS